MGTTYCKNLKEHDNACDIHNCMSNVVGLPSSSSSPTDTWILYFNDGTRYMDIDIKKGFLKFFINPDTIKNPDKIVYFLRLEGLKYEIKVYRDIVKPLIDKKICPNFVRYLSSSEGCTISDLKNMLVGKAYIDNDEKKGTMSQKQAIASLYRNVSCIVEHCNRPAINDVNGVVYQKIDLDMRYSFLINEYIDGAISFKKWLKREINHKLIFNSAIWKVIFQVGVACYAMSLSKMVHNDLHHSNVWCQKLEERMNVTYIVDGKIHSFNTDTKALVFDFDRSYVVREGKNPLVDIDRLCNVDSQCNEFIPNKDIIKFLGYAYKYTTSSTNKKDILKCIAKKTEHRNFIKGIYEDGMFLQLFKKDKNGKKVFVDILRYFDYSKFYSMEVILENISKLAKMDSVCPKDQNKDNIFICDKMLFKENGELKDNMIEKLRV